MASRRYPQSVRPGAGAAKAPRPPAGTGPTAPREATAAWPAPGPLRGAGFNRATKVPVVKTRPVKRGVD